MSSDSLMITTELGKLAAHFNHLESIGKATNQTNMVFLDISATTLRDLKTYLLENDVIISGERLVFPQRYQ